MYLALGGWSEVKEAARFLLKIKPAPEDAIVSEPQVGLCSIEVKIVDAQGQAVEDDYSLDLWRRRLPGDQTGNKGHIRGRTGQWYNSWEQRGGIQSIKRVSKREELYPGEYIITADHALRKIGDWWDRDPTPTGISDVIYLDGVENRDAIAVVRLEGDAPLTIRFVDSQTLEPVGEASHWLYRDDGRMLGNGGHADANGILRYRSLKAGTYRLESRGRGPGMAKRKEYVPLEEPVKVEVIRGQENEVTIRLDPNELTEAQIQKRWPWSVTGTVRDEQGRPMEGVRVQVAAGWGTLGRSDEDVTDADGRYTLRFIAGGFVTTERKGVWYAAIVSAFKDGYYEANLCSQGDLAMAYEPVDPNSRGKRWRYQGVVLPNEPYEVDFVMVPAARVKGRLIDEENSPIAGKDLWLAGEGLYPASSVLASVETDADGRFVVDSVPRQICWFTYRYERRKEVTTVPIDFSEPVEYEVVLVYEEAEYGGRALKVEKAEPKVSDKPGTKVEVEVTGPAVSAAELGEMRASGEEILRRMREVNRYWLVGPAPEVKNYAYDFVVIREKREKIEISDPREVFRDFRQGIAYYSVVHRVVCEGADYTITEVAEDEGTIRLDFGFEDPIKISGRNGVASGCHGCFSAFPKKASLWLDAATMVPLEVKAEEVEERFSEYASAAEGCYVPLRIEIEHKDSYFDWRFRLHEPGLWLFEEGRFAEEGKEPAPAALVEKVRVNDASITETKVPSYGTDWWPTVLSVEQGQSGQGAQQLILTTLTRKDVTVRAVAEPGRMVFETVGTLPVKDGKRPSIQLVAAPDVADLWSKKRKELREATVQLLAAGERFVKPGHLSLRCVEDAGQCEVRFLFMGPEGVERRIKVTVELRDANGVSLATMTRRCADGRIYARANREPDRSGSRREETNLERFYVDLKLVERTDQIAVTFEETPPPGSASQSTTGAEVEVEEGVQKDPVSKGEVGAIDVQLRCNKDEYICGEPVLLKTTVSNLSGRGFIGKRRAYALGNSFIIYAARGEDALADILKWKKRSWPVSTVPLQDDFWTDPQILLNTLPVGGQVERLDMLIFPEPGGYKLKTALKDPNREIGASEAIRIRVVPPAQKYDSISKLGGQDFPVRLGSLVFFAHYEEALLGGYGLGPSLMPEEFERVAPIIMDKHKDSVFRQYTMYADVMAHGRPETARRVLMNGRKELAESFVQQYPNSWLVPEVYSKLFWTYLAEKDKVKAEQARNNALEKAPNATFLRYIRHKEPGEPDRNATGAEVEVGNEENTDGGSLMRPGMTAKHPWDPHPGDSPSVQYVRTLRLLAQGSGTREEAAARFRAIAEQVAGSRQGETADELARLLEEMVEEDRQFQKPEDLSALSEGQLIDYYVYKLRDVAAVQHVHRGKCFVLYYNRPWLGEKGENAALKLRKIGKPAVPRLIELLDDRRPTRSMGGSSGSGEHLLRYGDVALQVIEAIAGREFGASLEQKGLYLVDSRPAARQAIISEVKHWWNENKGKTEAEWIRESLLESGIGLGSGWSINRVKAAERLVEIEGAKSTDFFRQLLKAEPDCNTLVRLLWQAGGKAVLDDIRPKVASGSFYVRMAAYRALMEAGEPGIVERLISEVDEFVKKPRQYDRRLIDLLIVSDQEEGVLAVARLLRHDKAEVVETALISFRVVLETEDMPSPNLRPLVFPYMALNLDADPNGQPASDWQKQVAAGWLIKAAGLPFTWPSEPSKAKYEGVVEQVRSWWAQQAADSIGWGQVAEGLQLGLSPDRKDGVYGQGELVGFEVHVRNVGDKEVPLVYEDLAHSPPGLQGTTEKPMILNTHIIGGRATVGEYRFLLRPSELKILGKVQLQLEPRLGERQAEYSADLEPGEYPIRQTVKFGSFTEEESWRGQLTTGEMKLVVEELMFGPVIEQSLKGQGEPSSSIDFDTQRTLTPEMETRDGVGVASFRLCRKQGIDAIAQEERAGLAAISMKVVRLDESDWDTMPPAKLAKLLKDRHRRIKRVKQRGYGIVRLSGDSIFGFKTRDGGIGMVRIVDFKEDPWGVKIRYKMVEQSRAEKNAS
ncbi:MAG: hypothetical protein ACYSUV_01045 [Planctomycetota bacterium]|jgi:hypothetical protein